MVSSRSDANSGGDAFLSAHALSRFLPAWESDDPAAAKIINLAGYRRRASADMDAWDFYITADAWTEVAAGFNKKALAETLAKNGFLEVPEKGAHRAKMVRVTGIAKGMRLYHSRILETPMADIKAALAARLVAKQLATLAHRQH
jgi:hypothetical protein